MPGRSGLILGIALLLLMGWTASAAAQSVTGPSKSVKPLGSSGADTSLWEVEWPSWSEDDVVARLVHQPVKLMELSSLDPETMLELKQLLAQAEVCVRDLVQAFSRREVDLPTATASLEAALSEYGVRLSELTAR